MGPVKDFFAEKGLTMKDLPVALLSYEFVSIFWWAGCWAGCYHVQPGKFAGRLLPLAQREKTGAVFTKALGVAEAQVAKATWISRLPLLKTAERPRLVVSLAESLVLRGAVKPISLAAKLWLSYNMVMLVKKVTRREQDKQAKQQQVAALAGGGSQGGKAAGGRR